MYYSNLPPIIQEEDEYADMPALIENDSDEDYADMPPLVAVDVLNDNFDDEMPELVAGSNVSQQADPPVQIADWAMRPISLEADQFVNNLQVGDTFKTSANYHVIYQGKREGEGEELYNFQIVDLNNGQSYDTHYSKLGTYVSMGLHEKVNAPLG